MLTNATRLRPRSDRRVSSPSKTKPFVVTRDQHCQDLRSRPPHTHPKAPVRQTIPKIFGILRPSPHQGPPKVKTLFTMSKNQTQKTFLPTKLPVPYGSPPKARIDFAQSPLGCARRMVDPPPARSANLKSGAERELKERRGART